MSIFRRKKRQSETSSIVILFTELETPLLAYAYSIVRESEVAQDVVQDAFLKLHQSEIAIVSPKAWLYRTVHNLAINISKRRSKESSFEHKEALSFIAAANGETHFADPQLISNHQPCEELERSELLELARLTLAQLDSQSQTVVQLKFLEDKSYKQISEQTGLSVSNVGYILHQSIKSLASEFQNMGVER